MKKILKEERTRPAMRCGECGREIEDGSRYCPWCGATSSFTPSGKRSGGKRTAMMAALAVVALVIVAAFVASMDNNRTDDKTLNPSTQPDGGSTVVFTDVEGRCFSYEVQTVETLEATAIEEMVSSEWDLTLFTCTVGGAARVTVRCRQTDDIAADR